MQQILQNHLHNAVYHGEESQRLSKLIAEEIKTKLIGMKTWTWKAQPIKCGAPGSRRPFCSPLASMGGTIMFLTCARHPKLTCQTIFSDLFLMIELELGRYKYVVNVVMGENLGEGARMDSRCYWDPESDGSAQAFFSNVSIYQREMLPPDTTLEGNSVITMCTCNRHRTLCGARLWRLPSSTTDARSRRGVVLW